MGINKTEFDVLGASETYVTEEALYSIQHHPIF